MPLGDCESVGLAAGVAEADCVTLTVVTWLGLSLIVLDVLGDPLGEALWLAEDD